MKKNPSKRKNTKSNTRCRFTIAQKTIMGVIAASAIIVVIAVICSFTLNTENVIKSGISTLSSNYYKDYVYKSLSDNNSGNTDLMKSAIQTYKDTGLATIPLRVLLKFNQENAKLDTTLITDRCDQDNTYVKIFPESPYEATSFRAEYNYSCEF